MRHDEKTDLKAEVPGGTVLEQQEPPWQLDRRHRTCNASTYRRGAHQDSVVPVFDRWCGRPPLAEGTPT